MQQIQFYREGIHSYMILPCENTLDRSSYEISLLEICDIPGFMRYEIRVLDEKSSIYYKLKYRTSLKQVLGDIKFTLDKVKYMIASIAEVIYQAEAYLLNPECIVWKSDTTFIEINSGKLLFSYYPMLRNETETLKGFLTELVQYVDKKDEQTYMYFMGFYNLITNPDCKAEQLVQYMRRDEKQQGEKNVETHNYMETNWSEKGVNTISESEKERDMSKKMTIKHSNRSMLLEGILVIINLMVVLLLLFEIWTYQYIWVLVVTLILLFVTFLVPGGFGEEKEIDNIMEEYWKKEPTRNVSFLEEDESHLIENMNCVETTVLAASQEKVFVEDRPQELYLKAMNPKKYPDLIMEKKSMVIGSMQTGCDYVLMERGISRMHAKLIKKEDGLYILDMNSTNQTYLNEHPLVGGEEYLLKEGDVLSLAGVINFVVVEREC